MGTTIHVSPCVVDSPRLRLHMLCCVRLTRMHSRKFQLSRIEREIRTSNVVEHIYYCYGLQDYPSRCVHLSLDEIDS